MMKIQVRTICFLLAALTVLLTACGGNPEETTESGETAEATTDPSALDSVPKTTYDGYQFNVLMTNLNSDAVIIRDFLTPEGDTVIDEALYRRNMKVSEKLDITFNGIADYSSSNTGLMNVKKTNTARDNAYDMCIIATYDAGSLALTGDLANLSDYGYVDLSAAWWDQNIKRDLSMNGNVFFTTGDISLVTTQAMYNVVFNKDMFDDNGWQYPYEAVKEGSWTFDMMKGYIMQVTRDLDGNDIMDSNDLYGLVYIHSSVIAALGMSGERFAKIDSFGEIELTLNTERAEKAITDFITLTQDKQHVYNGQTGTGGVSAVDMFSQGHCLFRMIEHIGFPHFRDTELNYGILPLPKLDAEQSRYYTPFGGWDAAFVCIPVTTENTERTSHIIEYTAYISRQLLTPAYYERTLVGRYVRDDESYDMITLEIQNRVYDIGYIYNFGGIKDGVETLSKRYSTAFASMWASYKNAAQKAVQNANDILSKIS